MKKMRLTALKKSIGPKDEIILVFFQTNVNNPVVNVQQIFYYLMQPNMLTIFDAAKYVNKAYVRAMRIVQTNSEISLALTISSLQFSKRILHFKINAIFRWLNDLKH